ncbi:hypothetical protein BC832DRAFT_206532 [Gaertneriomyces semiglobifer]|nr:hypothetical protein BC832DRAFT_206532 [Gaertneriomyces semiglobifer]
MSLSSTLLLKPNEHSPILLSHMNADLLESLFRLGKDLTEFRPYDTPDELELEMRKVCKMAKTGENDNEIRKLFAKHIANYADSNEEDIRIIDTMYHLYTTLPLHRIEPERQSELDLCVSYLRPVLARFVDVAGSIHGSWPNTASSAASAEKKALKDGSRARQPDFKLFTINQYREAYECGFGEVKPASKCTDKYACNLDLLRLSRFAKQALDELYRKKIFVKALPIFQCIGEKLWIYSFFHAADGLYVMMETGCIGNIPTSRQSLLGFVDEIGLLMGIWRTCVHIKRALEGRGRTPVALDHLRPTITTPQYKEIIESRDCSRRSWVRHK